MRKFTQMALALLSAARRGDWMIFVIKDTDWHRRQQLLRLFRLLRIDSSANANMVRAWGWRSASFAGCWRVIAQLMS
jgi:hypothetical protein